MEHKCELCPAVDEKCSKLLNKIHKFNLFYDVRIS